MLRERRSRWLASARFQRWASRVPGLRGIARRRARTLFDLCAGFVYSQILLACVRLQLLERLRDGPRCPGELAERLELPPEAMLRLLAAAGSLGLTEARSAGRFGLGPLGAALLGNPSVSAMVAHHPMLYADLEDPVALLRGERGRTALARYWPYADAQAPETLAPEAVADYSALMAASQALISQQVLDAYPVRRHRCLLDVGGGDGSFLAAAAARAPELRLVLFDLPPVAALARRRLEEDGLAGRSRVVSGDFFSEPLPRGADLISLIRVVHDHDDDPALRLLRAVRDALGPDGVLLLAEPMSGAGGDERIADAYFGFYLLAMGSGRARSPQELTALLRRAGFGRVEQIATHMPLQARLLVARPAASGLGAGQVLDERR